MAVKSSEVIATAKSYDGYLEKKTNASLDDFTKNAGSNNWTKFGRDYDTIMGTKLNGQSWCAMALCMWFVYTYGIKAAKKMLGGNLFAYTPTGAAQMGAKKGVTPKAGDVVFFYNTKMGRIAHVALVTKVDKTKKKFYTCEGNTSSDLGVVRNGGSVNQKEYPIDYALAYFATPLYGSVTKGTDTKPVAPAKTSTTANTTTTTARAANGNPYKAPADGVILKVGRSGTAVKWLQFELNQWKSSLKVDGKFGSATEAQVRAYQKAYNLTVDGEAGPKTIGKLKKDGK